MDVDTTNLVILRTNRTYNHIVDSARQNRVLNDVLEMAFASWAELLYHDEAENSEFWRK